MTMTTDSNNDDENKRFAEEAEDIDVILEQVKKDTSIFLLTVLQSMIGEQITAKQLSRNVGDYIYQAVKDQAIRKGWID